MNQDTLPPLEETSTSRSELFDQKIEPVEFASGAAAPQEKRNFFLRPVSIAIWLIFLSLALVVWFMLTAKSVSFEIEPSPDSFSVEGGLLRFEIGGRHLLRPGDYGLIADKTGYHRLEQDFVVSGDPSQTVTALMQKLPGILAVSTEPVVAAQVVIDGEEVGLTPVEGVRLEPGTHEIIVRAKRFLDYEGEVEIEGMEKQQTFSPELIPNWAPVSVASKPPGAELWVDGELLGQTPLTAEVEAGEREFELRLDGHNTWSRPFTVEPDVAKTIDEVVLKKADGRLSLASVPSGASVTVNGKYRGRTPLKLSLPPGRSHEIKLNKAGYEPVSRSVEMRSNQGRSMRLDLAPLYGELKLSAQPADAEVIVDGESRGSANQTLTLTALPHEIEITKAGYESYRQKVTPKPGFPQAIRVSLRTLEQAKFESTPTTIKTKLGQELKLIRPQPLSMGSSRREQGRRSNETLREVALTRPYYIATREVTNREFRAFSKAHQSGQEGRYTLNDDQQPVVNVTWQQAAAYCNWLSQQESLPPAYVKRGDILVPASPVPASYRLPTEAEWSWAARYPAGKGPLKFPWGAEMPPTGKAGNYADQAAKSIIPNHLVDYDDRQPVTAKVGSFPANGYGLFDLGGNVSEWVHDYYNIPVGAAAVVQDPLGPADGKYHVIRGSSWMHASISELRFAYRDYGDGKRVDLGFRIARFLE